MATITPAARRPSRLFEHVVAGAGFAAAVCAALTLLIGVLFVGASLDMLADPSPMLAYSAQQSEALRWANVTSLFGYGALLLPAVFFIAARLHVLESRIAPLAQATGVGYITFAGINAALLLSVWPAFQHAYPLIDPAQRPAIEVAFTAITDAAEVGIQALAYVLGGSFWLLSGAQLRPYRRGLGWTSMALGVAAWAAAIGLLLRLGPVAAVALGACFVLTPLWSCWVGVLALKSQPDGRRIIDIGPPGGRERREGERRQPAQ